jgi:hypothetical protein
MPSDIIRMASEGCTMGTADLDFLAKEWPVITGAPHLFWGGIITTIVFAVPLTWFVVNWSYKQRLKLADEREAFADKVKNDIASQFKDFKEAVAAGAGIDAITARVEKLEASHNELTAANDAVRSAMGVSVGRAVGTSAVTGISGPLSNTSLASSDAQAKVHKWWE